MPSSPASSPQPGWSGACANPRSESLIGRAVEASLWAALAVNLVVWLRRVASAVRFDRPFLGSTSGCEEEMLFSVWKAIHGLPVYTNPWRPPFTDSPYGWLFFHAHAVWSRGWLAVLGLDDVWLPTVSRTLTVVGMAVAIVALRCVLKTTAGCGGRKAWLLAAVAIMNPLFHWWSFTTRPDMWALALELVALAASTRAVASERLLPLAPVAFACYLAWAFRQSSVSVLVGVGFALLLAGRGRHLAALVTTMAVAFGVTFAVLGSNFWESAIVAMALAGDMDVARGLHIGGAALAKDPLLAASVATLVPTALTLRRWWSDPVARLLFLSGVFAAGFHLVLAGRTGADTNYLFTAAAILPCVTLATAGRSGGMQRDLFLVVAAGGLFVAAAVVLTGGRGRLSPADDEAMHRLRALRDRLPQPIFCTNVAANVPWVLGDGVDSMVVGFPYEGMMRARPTRFDAGTVERMLQDGSFETIIFAERHGRWRQEDADLTGYAPGPQLPGFTIRIKEETPGKPR